MLAEASIGAGAVSILDAGEPCVAQSTGLVSAAEQSADSVLDVAALSASPCVELTPSQMP